MKLNLRDFFWLTFVAAVVTMWWMDRSLLANRLKFYEMPKPIAKPALAPPLAVQPFQPYAGDDPFAPAPLPASPAPAPAVPSNDDPFGAPVPAPAPAPAPSADPFGAPVPAKPPAADPFG